MALNMLRSQIPAALGLSKSTGGLEKLKIWYQPWGREDVILAHFNPTDYTISHQVSWQPKETALPEPGYVPEFVYDNQPPTLTLELFFDTYEKGRGGTGTPLALFPGAAPSQVSVAQYTDQVAKLATIDQELHHPPICRLLWGREEIFEGVLTSLSQRFALFQADGVPVRAILTCTFSKYQGALQAKKALDLHSADVARKHTVLRGDTLQSIAAEAYGDPGLWREIARANQIINPRKLQPGTVLSVPKLQD